MNDQASEGRVTRLVVLALASAALIIAALALWRVRVLEDEVHDAAPPTSARTARAAPAKDRKTTAARADQTLRVARRIDDIERKLGLLVAKVEGKKVGGTDQHASERKRIEGDIAALRREMRSLAMVVSQPVPHPTPDAGAHTQPDADADGDDDDDGAGASPDTATAPDAGVARPVLVERDKLLQTLRQQAIREAVRDFAAIAGLDDASRADVEDIVQQRRRAHGDVIRDVTAGTLSVRDASIRIERANAAARRDLEKTLSADHVQRFQTILSRLDALWWRF